MQGAILLLLRLANTAARLGHSTKNVKPRFGLRPIQLLRV